MDVTAPNPAVLRRIELKLPAQGAAEPEATIIEWQIAEGETFTQGQSLAQVDSAKSIFDFEAPFYGKVVRRLCSDGDTIPFTDPVLEVDTTDPTADIWLADEQEETPAAGPVTTMRVDPAADRRTDDDTDKAVIAIHGIGSYLPSRIVTNEELCRSFPGVDAQYIQQVTGIRERRWAEDGEKPSDMAYGAALEAIRNSKIPLSEIDAVILATTTPDAAMPSTACIVQERLNLRGVPAFDLNAACSGWLYAVSMAMGMISSGQARNVLTVAVDMQSRLLDPEERNALIIFGDGAGAAVISNQTGYGRGHRLHAINLGSDTSGLHLARRDFPGYYIPNGRPDYDPWVRMEGPGMFRLATAAFAESIHMAADMAQWSPEEIAWVVPHQANARILRAAAKKAKFPEDRLYLNVDRVGNTSSASIPVSLVEMAPDLKPGDKIILSAVGAGVTTAAAALEW
jgi:3-oxoacyl-[acyl-carrier-protein] synthase-3